MKNLTEAEHLSMYCKQKQVILIVNVLFLQTTTPKNTLALTGPKFLLPINKQQFFLPDDTSKWDKHSTYHSSPVLPGTEMELRGCQGMVGAGREPFSRLALEQTCWSGLCSTVQQPLQVFQLLAPVSDSSIITPESLESGDVLQKFSVYPPYYSLQLEC